MGGPSRCRTLDGKRKRSNFSAMLSLLKKTTMRGPPHVVRPVPVADRGCRGRRRKDDRGMTAPEASFTSCCWCVRVVCCRVVHVSMHVCGR